jgi:hypothetical protein
VSNRRDRTITLGIRDLAIVASALQLASATAMMYGKEGRRAKERLMQLTEEVKALCPFYTRQRSSEYAWFDAFTALANAEAYAIHIEDTRKRWGSNKIGVYLLVDNITYEIIEISPAKGDAGEFDEDFLNDLDELNTLVEEACSSDAVKMVPIRLEAKLEDLKCSDAYREEYGMRQVVADITEALSKETEDAPGFAAVSNYVGYGGNIHRIDGYARPDQIEMISALPFITKLEIREDVTPTQPSSAPKI